MENGFSGVQYRSNAQTRCLHWPLSFIALLLLTALAMMTSIAKADELHLLINGKAIHLDAQPDTSYNESNWGAGLQYDFGAKDDNWVPFATASGFIDSNKNPSYYAGGGLMRRYTTGHGDARVHYDLGIVAFVMIREGFKNDKPFLGALPAFSVGTDKIALNMTYIPRVDPKSVPLVFFQLKIRLNSF